MDHNEMNMQSIFDYIESNQDQPINFEFQKMSKNFIPSCEKQLIEFYALLFSQKRKKNFLFRFNLTNKALYRYSVF